MANQLCDNMNSTLNIPPKALSEKQLIAKLQNFSQQLTITKGTNDEIPNFGFLRHCGRVFTVQYNNTDVDLTGAELATNILQLAFVHCTFRNFEQLKQSKKLKNLCLNHCACSSVVIIFSILSLETLEMMDAGQLDCSKINQLCNLTFLDISRTRVGKLNLCLPLLKSFSATQCGLSELSISCPLLESLNANENCLASVTLSTPILQDINLERNQLSSLNLVTPLSAIDRINLSYNNFSETSQLDCLLEAPAIFINIGRNKFSTKVVEYLVILLPCLKSLSADGYVSQIEVEEARNSAKATSYREIINMRLRTREIRPLLGGLKVQSDNERKQNSALRERTIKMICEMDQLVAFLKFRLEVQ